MGQPMGGAISTKDDVIFTVSCPAETRTGSRHRQRRTRRQAKQGSNIFFFKFIYLFFGCVGSLLLCTGFSLAVESGGYSSFWCAGFSWGGFSCCRARALGRAGFSSCGTRAQ